MDPFDELLSTSSISKFVPAIPPSNSKTDPFDELLQSSQPGGKSFMDLPPNQRTGLAKEAIKQTFDFPGFSQLKENIQAIPEFTRGVRQGITFGRSGNEDSQFSGSIFKPSGDLRTTSGKVANVAGQVVGGIIPAVMAEMVAGVAIPTLIAEYGLDAVVAARAHMALTGALYEGAKGASLNRSLSETIPNMVGGAAGFTALGMGMKKGGEFLGKYLPELETQYFVGTPQKMAEKLQEQGKPSLGEQVLSKEPELQGFKPREQVRADAIRELKKEDAITKEKLAEYQKQATTPNVSEVNVPESERFLPPPGPHQVVEPANHLPYPQNISGKAGRRVSDNVGEGVIIPKVGTTQPSGSKYESLTAGRGLPVDYTGQTFEPTSPESNFEQMVGGLGEIPPGYMPKKGPYVDIENIVNTRINQLANQLEKDGEFAGAKMVRNWGERFLKVHGPAEDLLTANETRSGLDSRVGKKYQSLGDEKLSPRTEAQMEVANAIRQKMSELAPDVAQSLERQHRLLNVVSSLSPLTAKSGEVRSTGFWRNLIQEILGSRENYALAQLLRAAFGETNPAVANVAKQTARVGLSEMKDNTYNRGQR